MHLDYHESRLKNGIRVISSRVPHVDSVALGIWVGVGGRYETRTVSGISHFIEHLLFKGTRTRTAQEISQAIEGRGGYFNAFTQEESTCYYARVGKRHIWNIVDILTDMYRRPRFAAEDIRKERSVIIEEIMMYQDQPQHIVQENLGTLLWADHALGRPLIGSPENVLRMSRRDILDFKKKNYVPNNTIISFAGNIKHDDCVEQIQRVLGDLSKTRKPSCQGITSRVKQSAIIIQEKDIEQTHLALGVRLFGRKDTRRYALKLLSVILGENMSSRLFQTVREKHGMAYSIHSSVHLFRDTGVFNISAGLDRKRATQAFNLVVKEIKRIKEKRVQTGELRRAKDYAIGQLNIGLESTTNQMIWMGEYLLGYGRVMQPEVAVEQLEKVTADEVRQVAGDTLLSEMCSLAMVSPTGTADQQDKMMEMLEKL